MQLFAPAVSITSTKRRRFLWAAWWTEPPTRVPFRKPDAAQGGARTREEARRDAERAAGRPLVEIEPGWARAWARVLVKQPPWTEKEAAGTAHPMPKREPVASLWTLLGVPANATILMIKRAFRERALVAHPDHGGDPDSFRALRAAYDDALRRRKRRPVRRK